ncbi:hypothetical protein K438DRAFT_1615054, partial [Mycena galopus ATCC 62051]
GFMNLKADFTPIHWSYKKTRLHMIAVNILNSSIIRRRIDLLPSNQRFHPAPPAAAQDIDTHTAKGILPSGLIGIHTVC